MTSTLPGNPRCISPAPRRSYRSQQAAALAFDTADDAREKFFGRQAESHVRCGLYHALRPGYSRHMPAVGRTAGYRRLAREAGYRFGRAI